jgi:hypothetical protein
MADVRRMDTGDWECLDCGAWWVGTISAPRHRCDPDAVRRHQDPTLQRGRRRPRPDFSALDHGSLVVVTMLSDNAEAWVEEHVEIEAYMRIGDRSFAVEPRYLGPILEGIRDAGLRLER